MKNLTPHIGIVGCSAEGAALCYRTICLEGESLFGEHFHPDVSLHNHSLGHYMLEIDKDDWEGVARLMLSSAQKLQKAGAEVLICPDNTIHQSYENAAGQISLPWLHIADVIMAHAKSLRLKHLGVLGTKFLMEGPVYRKAAEKSGIQIEVPESRVRLKINEIIFNELVTGKFTEESRKYFSKTIDHLKSLGCDGVVLGCTEIPLLISEKDSSLPILDSTRLLARAALRWAQENS